MIQPVQLKMDGKPLLVFVQTCRGRFNEQPVPDSPGEFRQSNRRHSMSDTFFFFSSSHGHRSWRSPEAGTPTVFIDSLARKLGKHGMNGATLHSISHEVITEVGNIEVMSDDRPIKLLPMIRVKYKAFKIFYQ